MPYSVIIEPTAIGELRRLPVDIQRRFLDALDALTESPFKWNPHIATKQVQGRPGLWSLTVSVWRAFYRVDGDTIVVGAFRHRAANPYRELKGR